MATMTLRRHSTARRVLAAFGAATALALLAGCASADPSDESEISGTVSILVGSADASDRALGLMNEAFEDAYPGVTVDFSSVPNDTLNAARSSRLTAGNVDLLVARPIEVPSYVQNGSAGDDALSADAGLFVDLTDEDFMNRYTDSVLEANAYQGHQFTVPLGVSYYTGVYYNKSIFDEHGLEIPTVWSEFIALCDELQSLGITPVGIGGKDGWPAGLTMISSVQGSFPTQADKNALSESLWTGATKLDDPETTEILTRVETYFSYAQANFAGVGYDAIPAGFANGEFAMTNDGTWNQPTIAAAVGDAFEVGYFPLPMSENASDNVNLGGKVELGLALAANAPNADAAMAWLDFVTDPVNYAQYVAESGTAPAQPDIPSTPFLDSIAPYTQEFSPAWDVVWVGNTKAGPQAALPFNYPALAPLGTSDAEEAARGAQAEWAAGL